MMTLYGSPASPFVRKTRMAALIAGVADVIDVQEVVPADNDATLNAANPLGKIPALVLEDGAVIFDSPVICEYLDGLAPSPLLFPAAGPARFAAMTRGALADGILEAAVLIVYEGRFRPESHRVQSWIDYQQAKVDRALAHLEEELAGADPRLDYGTLCVAIALGYLDFRQEGRWRAGHANLVGWLDAFAAAVPSFAETRPA